jgi:hypothetical protein
MKGWVKVVLGILAALLLLGVIAAVQLVRSGRWAEIRGFSGGMVGITRSAKSLERLDAEHPFKAPADGLIPEDRLLAFLAVCEAVKPAEGPYMAWMREHMGKKGDFKDAAEAIGFMARLMDTAASELRKQGMSGREFAWLLDATRTARKEAAEKAGAPMALELLQSLRKAAAAPGLDAALRAELTGKIARYEAWLAQDGTGLSPNAKLCLAHADRLKAADLGDLGEMIQGGMVQGGGRRKSQTAIP